MPSFFSSLSTLPEDPILGLQKKFLEDTRSHKLNLGIGIYPDEHGNAYLFRAVEEAERRIAAKRLPKNYQLIEGDLAGRNLVEAFLFHKKSDLPRVSCQTLGGTGSLRLGGEVAARLKKKEAAFPSPTWSNYKQIFNAAGLQIRPLPFYDKEKGSIQKKEFFAAVANLDESSLLVLQGPCQNPTGCDMSLEDINELVDIIDKKKLLVLLDVAYLGFGSGLDKDLAALAPFLERECLISLSFSKTLGVYGDRIGFLFAQVEKGQEEPLASQIRESVRSAYSSPPLHNNLLIREVLSSPDLVKDWHKELEEVRLRLAGMRQKLSAALQERDPSGDYQFIRDGKGMFSLLNLSEEKILEIRDTDRIYLPLSGRINIAGLTEAALPRFVDALFSS